MKCLSISQPFAELIVTGKKTIELRSWNTKFRGEFFVHAPQKIRTTDCKRLNITKKLSTGALVGKAEIYDVKVYNSTTEVRKDSKYHLASREFHNRRYGFIIKNPRKFSKPLPTKGRLGFFEVDIPKVQISEKDIVADIIDEEYRYQWIGHH